MSIKTKAQRSTQVEASFRRPAIGLDDIRDRLSRAIRRTSSEEALQRLIELAARCVSEAAAWDAFADAQDVGTAVSWTDLQRLEREANAAKRARIQVVDSLRAEMDE